jgi:hypothetical protein
METENIEIKYETLNVKPSTKRRFIQLKDYKETQDDLLIKMIKKYIGEIDG